MRIDRILAEARQAERAKHQRDAATGSGSSGEARPVSGVPPIDRVEISEAGRAMAMQQEVAAEGETLTPERLAELRERIREGDYNQPEVAALVARRLLESGDA